MYGRQFPVAAGTAALLWLACGSCGGSDPAPAVSLERLTAEPVSPEVWAADPLVVASYDVADDRAIWSTKAPDDFEPTPLMRELESRLLILLGRGARTVSSATLEHPVDPATFNQVQISAVVETQCRVRANFRRKKGRDYKTPSVSIEPSPELQHTLLQVPRSERADGPFDDVTFVYSGSIRNVALQKVELLKQPAEGLLPDPREGAQLVRIGDDWRRAMALTPTSPLETHFTARPGASLIFAAGELPETYEPDREVALEVTLESEAGVSTRSFTLGGSVGAPGWSSVSIGPNELGTGPVRATFAIAAGEDTDVACLLETPSLSIADASRPSVLLVTTDTHRGDYTGAANSGLYVSTPALDALAEDGVFFEQCFVTSNVTNPSHGALFTGLDTGRTRISSNNQRLGDAAESLAEVFQSRGYSTWAAVGVRHLLDDVSGFGQGFDRMNGPMASGVRHARETVDIALSWLEEERAPVFLWLHTYDAHWPYQTRPKFDRLYEDEVDHSKPPMVWHEKLVETRGEIVNLDIPRAQYKAEISYLDEQLDRLFGARAFRDGVVAVVGDHGEALGEHETYFTHTGLYPQVLHVPLIVRWPDAPRGARVAGIVNHIDLGRSLLDLAGLEDEAFPGRGVLEYLESGEPADGIHFALSGTNTAASITRDGMHLILHLKRHRGPYSVHVKFPHEVELYDLREDPSCLTNLVETRPELAAELRRGLIRWLEAADPQGFLGGGVESEELKRQLAELGYLDLGNTEIEPLWTEDGCEECSRFD